MIFFSQEAKESATRYFIHNCEWRNFMSKFIFMFASIQRDLMSFIPTNEAFVLMIFLRTYLLSSLQNCPPYFFFFCPYEDVITSQLTLLQIRCFTIYSKTRVWTNFEGSLKVEGILISILILKIRYGHKSQLIWFLLHFLFCHQARITFNADIRWRRCR